MGTRLEGPTTSEMWSTNVLKSDVKSLESLQSLLFVKFDHKSLKSGLKTLKSDVKSLKSFKFKVKSVEHGLKNFKSDPLYRTDPLQGIILIP